MTENAIDNIACLVGEGQLVEAESLCRNALFSAPDDISLLGLMGTICIARDKPEQAIPHLRKIMAREPGNTTAIRALAAALLALPAIPFRELDVSENGLTATGVGVLALALRRPRGRRARPAAAGLAGLT